MAKSFKNLMSEVAEPKAAGEKAFKAQHAVEKIDAQPSGQDHVFNGEMPPRKRLADYMKGQDAAAYDQASKLPDQGGDDSIVDMGEEAEDPDAAELTEDPSSERPMMMGSLRAMAHNLQGIARYISRTEDPEEWFQNKLAGVAREMQTLYGYATAEVMAMGESLEEASCGCGPDCEHCGGDHADAEVGKECDCCGNMIKEDLDEGILGALGGAALAHKMGGGIAGKVAGAAVGSAIQDRIAGKKKKESAEKIDARRLSFKEKAKALGYVKADPEIEEDAFKAKAAHAKMAGKDKMKMGDKEFPVTMKKVNAAKIVGEEVDEAMSLRDIKNKKEREERNKDKKTGNRYKDIKKKVYGNMMGGLKEEENLEEARRPRPPKISKGTAKGSISAKGIRGKGMKKFDVDVSVDNGKFSFRIQDESGAFQTVDIKKAAKMLGEEVVEELQEISKGLAGRYLKKAPARAADAGEKLGRAGSAYDKEQGAKDRKKSIRKFLNTQKGVERATNRLMRKEEIDESLEEKQRQKQARKLTPKEMRRALQTAKAAPKDKVSLKKAPWDESVELEEKVTFRTGIITLDDGEKVKLSRQDADLLTRFFRDLNPRNSKEMRKVLVKDKDGWNEILGFAREAL